VQIDPIKPTLKAPGSKRLKLNCDELLSSFAFKFNVRRYTSVGDRIPYVIVKAAKNAKGWEKSEDPIYALVGGD